jgi:hypothetical protein
MTAATPTSGVPVKQGWLNRSLNAIERVGNKLPDPAVLFALYGRRLGDFLGLIRHGFY